MEPLPSCSARELTVTEISKLKADSVSLSDFKKNKLEIEAARNWDLFYKRNTTKFFKDRHWTHRELLQLLPDVDFNSEGVLLEVGCGVGNFLFPFLQYFPSWKAYACDFSNRAVQFVRENADYSSEKCTAFVCDITVEDEIADNSLTRNCPLNSVDLCTLVFVLSAISPAKMESAARNIYQAVKAGGKVLVRDYGLYDHAMLRFEKGHKIEECFYVRQDGTRAYYFTTEKLASIFEEAGFETLSAEYLNRQTTNLKEDICVPRVFVQAIFVKTVDGK